MFFHIMKKTNQLVIMQEVKSSADDAATAIKSWTIPKSKWVDVKYYC